MEMAAPALCRAFTQNAWRRDLCSNCFRSKDEHKAAAAARLKTPSDAARLAATAVVKSILKGPAKSAIGSGKKARAGVSFHKEESQVIGYGGDDEIHSDDEGNDLEEVEPPSEGDLEREKAEQQELERLTKANTDFNSVIANLQLESITQEKPTAVKSGASGIPVPGGRSTYTGPLRLGYGSKDGDGNKKTLLVSVRPFGSDGEEVSKPVVKTKILVTNGYGNGVNSTCSAKESKDSAMPLVNGAMTNGFGLSSSTMSKETSLKVNVSSSVGYESKSALANGADPVPKDASIVSESGSSDSTKISENCVNGNCNESGQEVDEDQEIANLSSKTGEGITLREDTSQNVKPGNLVMASKGAAPVPANRSLSQQMNSGGSVSLRNVCEKKNEGNSVQETKLVNGFSSEPASSYAIPKETGKSVPTVKESLNVKNKLQAPSVGSSLNTNPIGKLTESEGYKSTNDGTVIQHPPVPAERRISNSKSEILPEESFMPSNEASVGSKENGTSGAEEQRKGDSQAETTGGKPVEDLQRSSSGNIIAKNMQEVESVSSGRISASNPEVKKGTSNVLTSLQTHLSLPSKKGPVSKIATPKQESQLGIKKSEEEPPVHNASSGTEANKGVVITSQKPAPISKRPAPSILKMGVPTGWHSKNPSQKNQPITHPGRDSNEDKGAVEKVNVANGGIKSQQSTGAIIANAKPSKPANTIAKLRANFVNNNLKIIAESAAKIVNGTRYGTKNAVADEIPMSKSSVMNLSMRPISTSSRTSKSFHTDDYELKDDRIKGLGNLDKVSNSFPSIRAKGSGPDIRELLRTPEKESEGFEFLAQGDNSKNFMESGAVDADRVKSLDVETGEQSSREITWPGEAKDVQKVDGRKELMMESSENARRDVVLGNLELRDHAKSKDLQNLRNELDSVQTFPPNKDDGKECRGGQCGGEKLVCLKGGELEVSSSSQASPESGEDGAKVESPTKMENGLDKTPPGEKNRKKGIVRRILFKGGNEIYRKAGEMVRSVRRSNESKDDAEITRDTAEIKDTKDLSLIGKRLHDSKNQDHALVAGEVATSYEVTPPSSAAVEETTNSMVKEIGGVLGGGETAKLCEESTPAVTMLPDETASEELSPIKLLEADEGKATSLTEEVPEKPSAAAKTEGTSQPPLMAPRPSFLHGRAAATQPWSLQSPFRNPATGSFAPGARSERAASVSALMSPSNLPAPGGQRGRLSSLPALEPEGRSNINSQAMQIALRKPGPIISGVKPAIPAKPSKILEASTARQGLNLTPVKPLGERKGSTTMSTPGSVGRSAGKRQAPKPPGMDMSEKRKCSSPEIVDCQKEIISDLGGRNGCDIALNSSSAANLLGEQQMENDAEACHVVTAEELTNESKNEYAVGLCAGMQDVEIGVLAQNQPSQLLNNGDEELPDDSALAPRGTHFVKNQALNASKSSSRVARETERRQMLIQLQSSNNRGAAMQPDGSVEVPNSVLLATSNTALSARQRSASLGRGVGVASPRPPLPGGSLGRAAGEGAALSIVTSSGAESTPDINAEVGSHDDDVSPAPVSSAQNPTSNGESANVACPVRSRSEGSLAVSLPASSGEEAKSVPGAIIFDTQGRESMVGKGDDVIYDSSSGMSAKKKKNTVRGFLKFLRRGSVRDDANGNGFENREDAPVDIEPKTRPVIVHPMELDGACVEVVKGGGIDVRRRLEEESALETSRSGENGASSDQSQSSPRRPTNISIAPPRPPPVMHSPSSPSLSSSSSSSSGSTPVRPRPPPPPRGQAPVPPSPGGSGQKPARPPPPKPAHLMRLGLLDREVPGGGSKNAGDGIYANLGEVRATLAPCKPQRTASMREVLGASGKNGGEAPTPRITPRVVAAGASSTGSVPSTTSSQCVDTKAVSSGHSGKEMTSSPSSRVPPLDAGEKSTKETEAIDTTKGDKLSWNVGVDVSSVIPIEAPGAVIGRADGGTDSSSEEENSTAPPLPLVPPPSLPPPLPLHPPPSPPSHATSSSSSSSIGNALILPEDSGYESVEFHGVHDGEVNTGRWWAESSIAASRGSVVTTTADSLEESYEAVVGANHRALADVLAQVCQPNQEEFGANMTLRWSDFLVEGPKGGVLRAVGPISFHRAALKGRASSSGRDSWRRVTLGIAASSMTDLPQYFRGCMCHDGGSAPVSRCMPSLRPMCTFQDEIPNRFFSSETSSGSAEVADLIEATVMVFNPLHFYSLKTYLMELIQERKSGQSFPPLPEESNWCNRACLFLLVLLDSLCSLDCSGGEDSLCVIREEAKPSPVVAMGDGQLGDSSHLACPLPRLLVLPNDSAPKVISSSSPSTAQCFQSVVTQIVGATGGDSGMESFAHALNCILGLFQGSADDSAALMRSRATLELWFFGPSIFHSSTLHSPAGDRVQEEIVVDARDVARWGVKNPILSVGEPESLSVEGELLSAMPRRWLDLERAGALRSLAVSALHRGSRVPSPLESGLEGSNAEEGTGVVGKCCRGWRVGEIGGRPTLPTCEEVRLRFLVGTSGSEVTDAWELLARNELSSPTSVVSLGRTFVDAPLRKLTTWSISNGPEIGEAQC